MARKLGVFGARPEVMEALEAAGGSNGNGSNHSAKPNHNPPLGEQMLAVGSTDWSPEQTEQYIDWRLQTLDTEIAGLRAQLEDLTALRKRWLAVTGGRSKMNGNGNGSANGSAGA
jgi:hypothetical protein